jgi:hypothetical protein
MHNSSVETNLAVRVRQGADAKTDPKTLAALAFDPSVTVRASLALNPALPAQIKTLLARDEDERVRSIFSSRIAGLKPARRGEMQEQAIANLTALVSQAALRVRASVAAAIKDLPDGPREIILRLASDPDVAIAEPVVRFSPALTSADLTSLLRAALAPELLLAVAQRSGIDAAVSDAVVETADAHAIGALLANQAADICDATLDALAAQSEETPIWQAPLIRRPRLPVGAQRILSGLLTGEQLQALAARHDLDPKLSADLRRQRGSERPQRDADMRLPQAMAHANALRSAGRLNDMAMLGAMRDNAIVLAKAMFAVRSDAPIPLIEKIFNLRDAKTIVALAWRAGMSMQTTIVLQAALAGLPPDSIMRAGPHGGFPMGPEEMRALLNRHGIDSMEPRRWTPRRLAASRAEPATGVPINPAIGLTLDQSPGSCIGEQLEQTRMRHAPV